MTLEKETVAFVGEMPRKLRCAPRTSGGITVAGSDGGNATPLPEFERLLMEMAQRALREALEAGMTYESLLLNNLNHPNDYGHALYAGVLSELLP
ncbi:hypothetical protein [Cohnella fermenti]|uniref:Uncharacterized protein n=1 Tax=Cohnella fermenti TaxID=2565925 RepID=A0A4S4BP93_9BACL|nr:hypothetical protein [Cohnella fermenti]THF76673.1 hypothetical protein E6C55_18025 [Cohnella fermenti]